MDRGRAPNGIGHLMILYLYVALRDSKKLVHNSIQFNLLLYQQYSTSDSTIMTNRVQHQLD